MSLKKYEKLVEWAITRPVPEVTPAKAEPAPFGAGDPVYVRGDIGRVGKVKTVGNGVLEIEWPDGAKDVKTFSEVKRA